MATGHKCTGCGGCGGGEPVSFQIKKAAEPVEDGALHRELDKIRSTLADKCKHGRDYPPKCKKLKSGKPCCQETPEEFSKRKRLEMRLEEKEGAEKS